MTRTISAGSVSFLVGVTMGIVCTGSQKEQFGPINLTPMCNEITQREFQVIRVVDGDTFKVKYDGDETSVRLLDIDTPERGSPGWHAAKIELTNLIEGRFVRLHFGEQRKRDNFGRLLCHVKIGQKNVGLHMLARKLAVRYEG